MPATSPRSSTFIPGIDSATERVREVNDRFADVNRKVAAAYLDAVEQYMANFAKLERKFGEQIKVDAAAGLLNTHAQLTNDVAKAGVSAARELIAA